MWAASRGRPVIAQDYGLVGRLVHEHHLGLVTDSTDPAALANAMADAVETERGELCDCEQMAAFAASRTPEAFAAAILDPLRPTAGHHGNSRRETAVVLQNSDSRPAAATAGTD
jgi:glycosyltransferase involved in cell wall biosynthesis